jgi:hypothetical protein
MSVLRMKSTNTIVALAAVAAFASAPAMAGEQAATPPNAKVFVAPLNTFACVSYCAVVNADGSLARGHAFTKSMHLLTGEYEVDFFTTSTQQKNISQCVWVATPGLGGFVGSEPPTFITVAGRLGTTNGVYIGTFNQAGVAVDAPFLLELSC